MPWRKLIVFGGTNPTVCIGRTRNPHSVDEFQHSICLTNGELLWRVVEDPPLAFKESDLHENPIKDNQDGHDKMLIAPLQISRRMRQSELGLKIDPLSWETPANGWHKSLQEIKVECDFIDCKCPWLQVELDQASGNIIIPNIAAGLIRQAIHPSKGNRYRIMNSCVTPEDIAVDKHQRLIVPTLDQVPHSDMAPLLKQLIALSRSDRPGYLADFAPSQVTPSCKQNPFVVVNWVVKALDCHDNIDPQEMLTGISIYFEEVHTGTLEGERGNAPQPVKARILYPLIGAILLKEKNLGSISRLRILTHILSHMKKANFVGILKVVKLRIIIFTSPWLCWGNDWIIIRNLLVGSYDPQRAQGESSNLEDNITRGEIIPYCILRHLSPFTAKPQEVLMVLSKVQTNEQLG